MNATFLFGGCPHCYTIAKVKVTSINNSIHSGYMRFYGWYKENNNGEKPEVGENIFDLINNDRFPISIVDTLYHVKNLPQFTDEKYHHKFYKNNISTIEILKWTINRGAGNFQVIPKAKCDFLMNYPEAEPTRYQNNSS